jgi:hypothetical protein
MGASCGGNGNVFEVDEAGGLEAREDGFGCLKLLGAVAMQELGEVDELWLSEMAAQCLYTPVGIPTGIRSPSACTAAFSIFLSSFVFTVTWFSVIAWCKQIGHRILLQDRVLSWLGILRVGEVLTALC